MIKIGLFGAGGKMGTRISERLKANVNYSIYPVETNEEARKRVESRGQKLVSMEEAVKRSDVIIMAVPDVKMKEATHEVVPLMRSGMQLILLDPAAAYYKLLPERQDISYFVSHPCHPPVFNDETTMEAKRDFFGGIMAKQSIVCALMQGSEEDYIQGEKIAKDIYAPILRSHRITVEQMTMLEPTMVETIAAPIVLLLREAMEEAIRRGIPREAARDFMLGHINIELAIAFEEAGNPFSDAALIAIEYGRKYLIQDNWRDLYNDDSIWDQVGTMLHPEGINK